MDDALYGATSQGGGSGGGTLFKLDPDGTGFSVLKNFVLPDVPNGGLIQGTDGALYGTSYGNFFNNYQGTVFKLNADGTGFTVIKGNFDALSGIYPTSALIQGVDGALYGTTTSGGSGGGGTVFKLKMDGSDFVVLKNFDTSTSGGILHAALMQGADGALYGTTVVGGNFGDGTLFKLNPDGTAFSVLKHFEYATSGQGPDGYGLTTGAPITGLGGMMQTPDG